MRLKNRTEAGQKLAQALVKYRDQPGIVYALPRGGVVPAAEIARFLKMPLDLIIPRKVGHPYNSEYAIAALTEDGKLVSNEREIGRVDQQWLKREIENQRKEARRRREKYLGKRQSLSAEGKIAIIVDDGIATGLTMEAAIGKAKQYQPERLVLAIPVVPKFIADRLATMVDELVGLEITEFYRGAVGAYYDDFLQVEDREVLDLMRSVEETP